METFKGLLYIRHGRIGTKSEGPEYHLQTGHGEYVLHFNERHPWELDYQLEHYCRRMIGVDAEGLEGNHLQVHEIRLIRNQSIPHDYDKFEIELHNASQSEIVDLRLGMVGSKSQVSIESLAVGSVTEPYEFLLKVPGEEPVPISYGDYGGTYTQNGVSKTLFIPTPDLVITVHFEDEGFSVGKIERQHTRNQ